MTRASGNAMTTKVKICGLTDSEALDAALSGGADYVGLVFYPPSPRNLGFAAAAKLAQLARGRARIVALVVDPADELLESIVSRVDPDIIQLHGSETPERAREIRARTGKPVMKAVKVAVAPDAESALVYQGAGELILFDAKPMPGAAAHLPGGNGIPFDWRALAAVKDRISFMLSGGLTPGNVAEAIRLTGAAAVDVSSGVERRPGEKDPALIAEFLAAAKAA